MDGFKFPEFNDTKEWLVPYADGIEGGNSEQYQGRANRRRRELSPLGSLFDHSPLKTSPLHLPTPAGMALRQVVRQPSGDTMDDDDFDGYENILLDDEYTGDVPADEEEEQMLTTAHEQISDEMKVAVFAAKSSDDQRRVDEIDFGEGEVVTEMKEVTHLLLLSNIEKEVVNSIATAWQHNSLETAMNSVQGIFARVKALFHSSNLLHSPLPIPSTSVGGIDLKHGVEGSLSDSGFSGVNSASDSCELHHQYATRSQRKKCRNTKKPSPSAPQSVAGSGSNSPTPTDNGDVFKNIDVRAIFERSEDSRKVWRELEANRNNSDFFTRPVREMDAEEGKIEKDFVRIVGYELMLTEDRLDRAVTATERREFMSKVLDALPIRLRLERYANFTSKGKLDMFVRNKRHYRSRKYGISTSAQTAAKKRT